MNEKRMLMDELTEAFVRYQWRLEHPIPAPTETFASMRGAYQKDAVFRAKVDSLTFGVMSIVDKYLPEGEKDDE